MIQRIQSLYLFIALVLNVICLCYPIGFFSVGGHEIGRMYNLWVVSNNIHYFTGWALFAILLAVQPIIVICIALYKKRMVQSRLCVLSSLLIVGYYICYLIFAIIFKNALKADFNISFLVRSEERRVGKECRSRWS